jgi:hypothetical protein
MSIDEDAILQYQGDINWWEVAAIMFDNEDLAWLWQNATATSTSQREPTDKFANYEGHEQQSTDPVPKEYRNYLVFQSKYLTGLPDRGLRIMTLNSKGGHNSSFSRFATLTRSRVFSLRSTLWKTLQEDIFGKALRRQGISTFLFQRRMVHSEYAWTIARKHFGVFFLDGNAGHIRFGLNTWDAQWMDQYWLLAYTEDPQWMD